MLASQVRPSTRRAEDAASRARRSPRSAGGEGGRCAMSMHDFFIVFATCLVTMLLCRCVPLFVLKGRQLPDGLARALGFIPPAAFAALVANDLLSPGMFDAGAVACRHAACGRRGGGRGCAQDQVASVVRPCRLRQLCAAGVLLRPGRGIAGRLLACWFSRPREGGLSCQAPASGIGRPVLRIRLP